MEQGDVITDPQGVMNNMITDVIHSFFLALLPQVRAPFKTVDGYIEVPNSIGSDGKENYKRNCVNMTHWDESCGKASYTIVAASATVVSFSLEVQAAGANDDSLYMWMDGSAPAYMYLDRTGAAFKWIQTFTHVSEHVNRTHSQYAVTAG